MAAFNKIVSDTGGQSHTYIDVSVQAGDLIWAQGTDRGGNCSLSIGNITAKQIGSVVEDGGRIRTTVWKALAAGTARVYISGTAGENWDLLVTVVRPDEDNEWTLKHAYDGTVGGSVQINAEAGNAYFITQHDGDSVESPPFVTGITYNTWDDVLPEGATGPSNGRMTTIKALTSGPLKVTSPAACLMVCWVEPVARTVFSEFVLV